ncbi:uncharacterized protein LOC142356822 [Convolutriloba macropyga]|uniref:uncharacterized protein LOC142356822 n=1 Tax=Convolutriloba macropyga TaxID=536237 RepID=UPI003F51CF86
MSTEEVDYSDDDFSWLPSRQPQWQALKSTPIPVEQVAVAAPAYTLRYRDMLGLLKCVQASGEKSRRVLDLTAGLISVNAASYTAWDLRWRCLCKLVEDEGPELLDAELDYMQDIANVNAKNYQLWNHRRKCALLIGEKGKEAELDFTAEVLVDDAKNYHAWSHRQAIVTAFGLWEKEEHYTRTAITLDVRNNSAWSQRMYVLMNRPSSDGDIAALRAREVEEVVLPAVLLAPGNPSPYNFLRGLYSELAPASPLCGDGNVLKVAEAALSKDKSCVPATELLADFFVDLATAGGVGATAAKQALGLFSALEVMDPIRAGYWLHRRTEVGFVAEQDGASLN